MNSFVTLVKNSCEFTDVRIPHKCEERVRILHKIVRIFHRCEEFARILHMCDIYIRETNSHVFVTPVNNSCKFLIGVTNTCKFFTRLKIRKM